MLSSNQQRALRALARCPTKREAAREAGISERSLRQYFNNPEFVAAVRELYAGMLEESTRAGELLLLGNMETCRSIRDDTSQPAPARISAARAIYEATMRGVEIIDIVERLEALEGAQARD